MRTVRLIVSEPLGTSESVYYHLPLRIGRHPLNDWQLLHPAIERFHLELDWLEERFVLRDLGQRRDVLVRIAGEMRALCGRELTTAARELEFAIAGVWVRASVEDRPTHQVAESAQGAADELVTAYSRAAVSSDREYVLRVLGALGRGSVALRLSLQAERERAANDDAQPQAEVAAALMRWAQASCAAVSSLEDVLQRDDRDEE